MLIKFRGENTGSIQMFGQHAQELLRLMGTSGSEKGALMAEDVPGALAKLEAAIEARKAQDAAVTEAAEANAEEAKAEGHDAEPPGPALSTRAVPLIELLKQAVATDSYVMWGP